MKVACDGICSRQVDVMNVFKSSMRDNGRIYVSYDLKAIWSIVS